MENAPYFFVHNLYEPLNTNNIALALFIDFRKSFDMVDHYILLEKIKLIGIRGNALNWFKSYLTWREQIVKLQNI